jgi:hypothetical protein
MAVTINEPKQVDSRSWLVSWSSDEDNPTYYVYKDGRIVGTTKDTQMIFTVEPGEALVIEVLDDEDAEPQTAYPGRLMLRWYQSPATDYYLVQEYYGGSWVTRKKVADLGQGYFAWQTRFLEDSTVHQFRIVPVGTNGNEGTAKTFSVLMVRHPDVPDVDYSYSDTTNKVTISER